MWYKVWFSADRMIHVYDLRSCAHYADHMTYGIMSRGCKACFNYNTVVWLSIWCRPFSYWLKWKSHYAVIKAKNGWQYFFYYLYYQTCNIRVLTLRWMCRLVTSVETARDWTTWLPEQSTFPENMCRYYLVFDKVKNVQ